MVGRIDDRGKQHRILRMMNSLHQGLWEVGPFSLWLTYLLSRSYEIWFRWFEARILGLTGDSKVLGTARHPKHANTRVRNIGVPEWKLLLLYSQFLDQKEGSFSSWWSTSIVFGGIVLVRISGPSMDRVRNLLFIALYSHIFQPPAGASSDCEHRVNSLPFPTCRCSIYLRVGMLTPPIEVEGVLGQCLVTVLSCV